jgi:hypothetical protein
MTIHQAELSRIVDVTTLARDGERITIEANEAQLAAIERRLKIPALYFLKGDLNLRPTASGLEVILTLSARAERRCVVSLEMMQEEVKEVIKLRLDRDFDDESPEAASDEWSVEPLEGANVDLGELLVQHLSLSLDPNPRKPGATSLLAEYRDATSPSPFSVLKGPVDRDD